MNSHVFKLRGLIAMKVTRRVYLLSLLAAAATAPSMPLLAASAHQPPAAVDAAGNLHVPSRYRTAYEFLGTWAIATDKGPGSKQMHDVYATRGTIAAFRKTGRFPEGTLLVKEVYESTTASMTTGTVSHAQILKGWFVMIKDSKNSHPDNKLWGDGWGWSWFDAGNPQKTTSTNYKMDCLSCHVPAQASDWIYTNGYPPLQK
jgi:hypothetical protein